MSKSFIQLVRAIQKQVIGILLVHDYVQLIDDEKGYKFANCVITQKGKKRINSKAIYVSEMQTQAYRKLFPPGRKGPGLIAVQENLEKFMQQHDASIEEIMTLTKVYIDSINDLQYVKNASYFLYKRDSGVLTSTAEEYLDQIRSNPPSKEPGFRDKLV